MIVIVGGAKGGVGKSLVSAVAFDYLLTNGTKPALIETDNSNPDTYKMYADKEQNGYRIEVYAKDLWKNNLNKVSNKCTTSLTLVLQAFYNDSTET